MGQCLDAFSAEEFSRGIHRLARAATVRTRDRILLRADRAARPGAGRTSGILRGARRRRWARLVRSHGRVPHRGHTAHRRGDRAVAQSTRQMGAARRSRLAPARGRARRERSHRGSARTSRPPARRRDRLRPADEAPAARAATGRRSGVLRRPRCFTRGRTARTRQRACGVAPAAAAAGSACDAAALSGGRFPFSCASLGE